MPEIDRDALQKKLETIPEQDREPYVKALQSKGYTWKSNATPQEPSVLSQTASLLSGGEFGKESSDPGFQDLKKYFNRTKLMMALDAGASAGKYINQKLQYSAGTIADKSGALSEAANRAGYPGVGSAIKYAGAGLGTALGTASQALVPTSRLGVAATAVGMSPGDSVPEPGQYKVPTSAQRKIAEVASVQSNVKPEHIAAVIANPEIMSDATPSMREVGKEYQQVFNDLGIKFDGKTYKEITGMRYPPNETQAARLKNIVADASEKLEKMKAAESSGQVLEKEDLLTPAEAFLARSAGKKVLTGSSDVATKRLVSQDVGMMDDFLENNGIPEVKALGQKYFRASAKESLSEAIPKLRNGKPAVVRSLVMAHYGGEALNALSEGHPIKAAIKAATGAAMSPAVQGSALPFLFGQTNPNYYRAAILASPQIKALQDYGQ